MNKQHLDKILTGWEIENLGDVLKNTPIDLKEYSQSYNQCALSTSQDEFVIIRKFASRVFDGKVNMLNTSDVNGGEYYPISHYGMTIVSKSKDMTSSHNIVLPNDLVYSRVELDGSILRIFHSDGVTETNFSEINKQLWVFEDLEEKEILKRFMSLCNFKSVQLEIKKHDAKTIDDSYFGKLIFNENTDCFEVTKNEVFYSFCNTVLDELKENFKKTEKLISRLDSVEKLMVNEMLPLKNNVWLNEDEEVLSTKDFQKEVKLHAVSVFTNGSAELYYQANDLFWGHEIQTKVDNKWEYKESTIVG